MRGKVLSDALRSAGLRALLVGLLALGVSGCGDRWLEVRVTNDSAEPASIELVSGIEGERARGAITHLAVQVDAGEAQTMTAERPGPGDWTMYVNGERVTDSLDWPMDNPTLDFTIVIGGDGRVDVVDD